MTEVLTPDAVLIPVVPPNWDEIEFELDGKKKLTPLVHELFILTKERGIVRVGDVINHAQSDFLTRCERQLNEKGRIRAVVLKARQIGLSTIIEGIIFVLAMVHDHINGLVISHEKDSAEALLGMTRRYWETYTFAEFHDEKYAGRTQLSWSDTGSNLQIATAKNVQAGRSRTIHALHASEVAFYDDPETLMTGLRSSIPNQGLSAVFHESTANGIGNFFHRTYTQASRGASEFEAFFYPWHEHPEYRAVFLPEEDVSTITLDDLDEEEQWLVKQFGLGPDRLTWRRYAIENLCQGDIDKFHQEYPATPEQAFVSTGRNVFHLPDLLRHYDPRIGMRGELVLRNGRVEFVESKRGWLTVFTKPSRDRSWGVYLIGGDPTHTVTGDNACAQVINRRTKEQVAIYKRKVDPIQFGKDLQMLGRWYHEAMVAPEREGPGYATVGVMAGDNYPNLYQGSSATSAKGHVTDALGWSTNSATKHLAIQQLKRMTTESVVEINGQRLGLVIHDEETLAEMRDYVTDAKGTGYENGEGSDHDDTVMALAIAVAVDALEPAPPAYTWRDPESTVQRPITTMAETEDGRIIAESPTARVEGETAETGPIVPWERWGEAMEDQ